MNIRKPTVYKFVCKILRKC